MGAGSVGAGSVGAGSEGGGGVVSVHYTVKWQFVHHKYFQASSNHQSQYLH